MRYAIVLLALVAAGCGGTKGAEVPISVTENGFEPSRIEVKHGQPVTLLVTRKTDQTCATEFVVPSRGITQSLPLNQTDGRGRLRRWHGHGEGHDRGAVIAPRKRPGPRLRARSLSADRRSA